VNRTQRRQLERSVGHRGSKAKRRGRPRPERAPEGLPPILAPELPPAVQDHMARHAARTAGLLVPPSPQEREALVRKGHTVPSESGLILP
jgi:hypothetical protein